MNILKLLFGLRHILVKLLEWSAIIIMATLVFVVLWGVFTRYCLGNQDERTDELATTLIMWASMLGASVAYAEKGHLGVDYFVGKLDPAAQRINEIAVHLIVALFAAVVLIYGGYLLASRTFAAEQMLQALKIKAGYKYIVIPFSGCFMVLFAFEHILELLTGKKNGEAAQ
ncbi:MAG: TRAP transporter small permease [Anaerohalosphaeraceae bacterium]